LTDSALSEMSPDSFNVEKHNQMANRIGSEFIDQAEDDLRNGDSRQAHRVLRLAFGFHQPTEPRPFILAARAAAACDGLDVAFDRLYAAAELGWTANEIKKTDTDWSLLSRDPRWQRLSG